MFQIKKAFTHIWFVIGIVKIGGVIWERFSYLTPASLNTWEPLETSTQAALESSAVREACNGDEAYKGGELSDFRPVHEGVWLFLFSWVLTMYRLHLTQQVDLIASHKLSFCF